MRSDESILTHKAGHDTVEGDVVTAHMAHKVTGFHGVRFPMGRGPHVQCFTWAGTHRAGLGEGPHGGILPQQALCERVMWWEHPWWRPLGTENERWQECAGNVTGGGSHVASIS